MQYNLRMCIVMLQCLTAWCNVHTRYVHLHTINAHPHAHFVDTLVHIVYVVA